MSPPLRSATTLIERQRLLARVDPRGRYRLVMLHAPAGYGKTSLLTQFFETTRSNSARVIWLTIDITESQYPRFLLQFNEALGSATDADALPSPAALAAKLAGGLAALKGETVICIDDYHAIVDPRMEQLMELLIDATPEHTSWVIGTREWPERLPLARLRLAGEILVLGAEDLRFTESEAHALLQTEGAPDRESKQFQTLTERTEGWPAALKIAALRASERIITDFFRHEILERVDHDIRDFLLDISVLDSFDVPQCNYLRQRTDSRRLLDTAEARSLFVVPLDSQRHRYRLHGLFREFLCKERRETDPNRWADLHKRAAQWLKDNGRPVEAVEHLLSTKDYLGAADLLDSLHLSSRGVYGVERFFTDMPEDILECFPNLQLERILEWQGRWEFHRSRGALARLSRTVEVWVRDRTKAPQNLNLELLQTKLAHRQLMGALVADEPEQMDRLAREWSTSHRGTDEYMDRSAGVAHMATLREHYRCDQAAMLGASLDIPYKESSSALGRVFHHSTYGLTLLMQGRIGEARVRYEAAYDQAMLLDPRTFASLPGLLLAEVHYLDNRLGMAHALLEEHLRFARSPGYVDKLVAGYIINARLACSDGRNGHELAKRALDDGQRMARDTGFERLRLNVLSERIRQLALMGNTDEILFHCKQEGLLGGPTSHQPRDGVNRRHELRASAWAGMEAARGNVDGALRLLKSWYQFTLARGAAHPALCHATKIVRLSLQRGDMTAACEYLRTGLWLADGGFVRIFLDEGPALLPALEQIITRPRGMRESDLEFARGLVQQLTLQGQPQTGGASERTGATNLGAAEANLSRRELDILELAADDVPNRNIATRLALSENTVKWYWKQIFEKLHVRRRAKAVCAAQRAGLIF
jgi:LuxR family maltose regulon positive regulatory protein